MTIARRLTQLPARDTAATAATSPTRQNELSQRIAALYELTAQQLREEWRRLYRAQPPRLSRDLLVRTTAYRMQELAYGGLSKATQRKLDALTKELEVKGSIVVTPYVPEAGHTAGPGVARQDAHGDRDGRRLRLRRKSLSISDQDRPCHYGGALVRTPLLRLDPQACVD